MNAFHTHIHDIKQIKRVIYAIYPFLRNFTVIYTEKQHKRSCFP